MCEHCEDPDLDQEAWEPIVEAADKRSEKLLADPDWPSCEFENDLHGGPFGDGPDGLPEGCPEPVAWTQLLTFPYEHLCEQHKKESEAFLIEEHGLVPDVYGVDGVAIFHAIKGDQPERCEAFDPDKLDDCGAPAMWVAVGTFENLACGEHYDDRSG